MEASDHDILLEIQGMLTAHVQRFEEHVTLDEKRETDAIRYREQSSQARELLSERMVKVENSQFRIFMMFGVMIVIAQVALQVVFHVWK